MSIVRIIVTPLALFALFVAMALRPFGRWGDGRPPSDGYADRW